MAKVFKKSNTVKKSSTPSKSVSSKSKYPSQFKAVGVSIGGQNKVVNKGSDTYKNLIAQGGVESAAAKQSRSTELKGFNKKGSVNYVPTPDDPGFENMDDINNEAVTQGIPKPIPNTTQAVQQQAPNPQTVNTGQPSPSTVQAGQGLPGNTNSFQQGFQATQAAGTPAPQSMGQAMGTIQSSLPPQAQDTSYVDSIFAEDQFIGQMQEEFEDYFSPRRQRESLTEEYTRLTEESGIDQLDTELMNMRNVIEGSEDDIRNEITKAGGFATESQVLAMTNSRNKSIIKNYNNLLETRENSQRHLDTMVQLSKEDRQLADQQFDRMFNMGFQIQEYKTKMKQNASDGYQKIVDKVGYAGLSQMTNGDPYYTALIEKTMGLGKGGLAQLASVVNEEQELDMKIKRAQLNKIYAETNEIGQSQNVNGTINGKPQNATQATANSYANRLNESNVVLESLGSKFTKLTSQLPALNFMKSGDRQAYEQAQKNFVTAVLRRESGASIAPSEFKTAKDIYFPKPGDTAATVQQKAVARNTVVNNFYRESNALRPVLPGQVIYSDGKKYKVGIDGETLTEI